MDDINDDFEDVCSNASPQIVNEKKSLPDAVFNRRPEDPEEEHVKNDVKNICVQEEGRKKTDEAEVAGPVGKRPDARAEQFYERDLPEKHDDRGDNDRHRGLGKAPLVKCSADR